MNKKIFFVLLLSLLLMGCGNNKTVSKDPTPEKEAPSKAHQYILEGKLQSNIPPHGTEIVLDSPLDFTTTIKDDQKLYSFSSITLDSEAIYNYIDRNKFTYEEPFIVLTEEAGISVKIKVDLDDLIASNALKDIDLSLPLHIKNFEVLAVDNNQELIDQSHLPYPFETANASADLTNRNHVIDYICSELSIENQKSLLQENLIIENVDFTGDGNEDAICYVNDVTLGFYDLVFISQDASGLKMLDFDGNDDQNNTHSAYFDGTFIHYLTDSSGSGISGKVTSLYIYADEKIKDTGGYIHLEGSEAQPPTPSYPEGYNTQTITSVDFINKENDYTAFKTTAVTTGSADYTVSTQYIFNAETGEFDLEMTTVTPEKKDLSYLKPGDIQVNQKIGGLDVSSVEWHENDSFEITLNGKVQVKGIIRAFYNDVYMENEYVFASNEALEHPIKYNFNDYESQIDSFSGTFTQTDFLDSDIQNYLLQGNDLSVTATITNYSYGDKSESEGYTSLDIESVVIADGQESSISSDPTNEDAYIDPKTIKKGQEFEGLEVVDYSYSNDSIDLDLKGKVESSGVITGFDDPALEGPIYEYRTDNAFEKPIKYVFPDVYTGYISAYSSPFNDERLFLSDEVKEYILAGNSLAVSGYITGYSFSALSESGKGSRLYLSITEITDEKWLNLQSDKKIALKNETITTTSQGDVYIDYSLYKTVVLPMHTSQNSDQLQTLKIKRFGNTGYNFTVIGRLENVQISTMYPNSTEGELDDIGTITNSVVNIIDLLNSDGSYIHVTGQVPHPDGTYDLIDFTLDHMRDISDYEIYWVEN